MWLLSTDRAELHFFPSAHAVIGGYAVLSHTWDSNEQTFQETQDLHERWKKTGENPRDLASKKVRQSCILAERYGYRWLWDDTCCIDKTSSTELSEAINSMFVWYSLAEVCFAYLVDVESDCDLHAKGSAFRTARWHSRGWALQELIAPSFVIFLSRDWRVLGNKLELAPLLEEITGVPRQVLTREAHFSTSSVAERMSWASKRTTTRMEDEGYCLMGLFDVNMPIIYGEGRRAFRRLQHEILRQSFDTSLLVWGSWISSENVALGEPLDVQRFLTLSSQLHLSLLAPSSNSFVKPFGQIVHCMPSVYKMKPDELEPDMESKGRVENMISFDGIELPQLRLTSYGLECRLPIIQSDGLVIAVLLCDAGHEHLGLLLHPFNDPVQDPSRRKYHTGYGFRTPAGVPTFARLISLGNDFHDLRLNGTPVEAKWRSIILEDSQPSKLPISQLCSPLHSIAPAPPFRLPSWLVDRLSLMGMELLPLHIESRPVDGKPLQLLATFGDMNSLEGIILILGTCTQSSDHPAHWAKAIPQQLDYSDDGPSAVWSHDCLEDHIANWPGLTKDFGDSERTIRLSFSRCHLTPEYTFVVHLELMGDVYNTMAKNITFPDRERLSSVSRDSEEDSFIGRHPARHPTAIPNPATQGVHGDPVLRRGMCCLVT